MDSKNGRTEKEFDEFQKDLIDLDDEFRFKCRKCGKCCTHQHTIIFTARDIFMIAKKLETTPEKVIEAYAEVYIGPQSNIPIVHMLPRGKRAECPFLKDGKCSIHDSKPTTCALFPLGRVMTEIMTGEKKSVKYFLQNINCGSRKQTHTVREWLSRFNIPENDEFFLLWSDTVAALAVGFRSLIEMEDSEQTIRMLWSLLYEELYLRYDVKKEFLPQFRVKAKTLMELSRIMTKINDQDPPKKQN